MEAIPLSSLLPADFDPKHFKVHFAVWNQVKHPIDVLATSLEEWQEWNSWRGANNDFNRQFIFSVAQDKHDATHWLFGGIWEVLERRPEPHALSYTVALREDPSSNRRAAATSSGKSLVAHTSGRLSAIPRSMHRSP